ncbi:TPA: histone family protein [archaeon]|uniref:Histone family protein n=1 Tax=Candidatus Naiadarchaeum limnaeum TaxID=2756139 RepID=A0A832URP0_9ARCH|nr:histone family protein [Candidatus Naiadarchaeales archaeon SRR2090153.bin1042]HIK00362.1 histone family protein [Candidatus Naiadarchaeum limnaeum]
MSEIPLAPMERLIKKAGAARVAEDAKSRMSEVLEDYAISVAARANQLAKHANRKTVTAADISLAVKEVVRK